MPTFVRNVLYGLRRTYGRPVRIFIPSRTEYTLSSGKIERDYNVYNIARAIVLPTNAIRDFVYDLAFIAANKNFTTGGYFEVDTLSIIIDLSQLPAGVSVPLSAHVAIGSRKYQVSRVRATEGYEGLIVDVKGLPETANVETLTQALSIGQTGDWVLGLESGKLI